MSFLGRVASVSGWTMVSRVFGFARDVTMASFLGAGFVADAFFIAFKLPNFFRRLVGEGAFAAGFVPVFAGIVGDGRDPDRRRAGEQFAGHVLGWLLPALMVLLLLAEWQMPAIMAFLTGADRIADADKVTLLSELGRTTFPYLLLISIVAMLSGILNALGYFAGPAFVPVLLNICMISAVLLAAPDQYDIAHALALAVTIAGVLKVIWLLVTLRRTGFQLRLRLPRLTRDVRAMFAVIGPAAISAGIIQINLLVDVFLAARYLPEGSVSWLFYGDRINQLVVGVLGVAIGTVLLPKIAADIKDGRNEAAMVTQNNALALAVLLGMPATYALIVVPDIIIGGLFERAAFTASDTSATAAALLAYGVGLPAFLLIKILSPGFLARLDSRTPMYFALMALAVNLNLNLALIGPMAHVGLALATSIAAWVNAGLLWWTLRRRGYFSLSALSKSVLYKAFFATIAMALPVQLIRHGDLILGIEVSSLIVLLVMIPIAMATYSAALWLLGLGPQKIIALIGK